MVDRLLRPRIYASIAVVLGILALVAAGWWWRGIDEASRLFQLLHGVLLATMTFLWGAEMLERADGRADEASRESDAARRQAALAGEEAAALEAQLARVHAILLALAADPDAREKVEDAARRVGGR